MLDDPVHAGRLVHARHLHFAQACTGQGHRGRDDVEVRSKDIANDPEGHSSSLHEHHLADGHGQRLLGHPNLTDIGEEAALQLDEHGRIRHRCPQQPTQPILDAAAAEKPAGAFEEVVEPVHVEEVADAADLGGVQMVVNQLGPTYLNVGASPSDEAVEADVSEGGPELGAGSSGAQEHQMAVGACRTDGVPRARGDTAKRVDERSVDIQEDGPADHLARALGQNPTPGSCQPLAPPTSRAIRSPGLLSSRRPARHKADGSARAVRRERLVTSTPGPAQHLDGERGASGPGPRWRGHLGWIVAGSFATGLFAGLLLVFVPIVPAQESEVTGAILCGFALGWALLAVASTRLTDQPQRWAAAPALFMGLGGALLLAFGAPMQEVLNWVWPPALLALLVWIVFRARRELRDPSRRWLLYPVVAILALASIGGGYQTVRAAVDAKANPMPGQLIDVGGHALHVNCRGSGSPTVVLEPGAGGSSSDLELVVPSVADDTRVCVYDRAGRGWSEPAGGAQDGVTVAADLHALLQRGNVPGPYVLAGHSFGGLYVLIFAARYPDEVTGIVLVDSTAPASGANAPATPSSPAGSYDLLGRLTALVSAAGRLATIGDLKNSIDEYLQGGVIAQQAAALRDLGNKPLVVVTASSGHDDRELAAQDALAGLSTNSAHRVVEGATHQSVIGEHAPATTRAILDVVASVRTGEPLSK